jgi:hypothetical protein
VFTFWTLLCIYKDGYVKSFYIFIIALLSSVVILKMNNIKFIYSWLRVCVCVCVCVCYWEWTQGLTHARQYFSTALDRYFYLNTHRLKTIFPVWTSPVLLVPKLNNLLGSRTSFWFECQVNVGSVHSCPFIHSSLTPFPLSIIPTTNFLSKWWVYFWNEQHIYWICLASY